MTDASQPASDTMVVGYDGSEASTAALDWAAALAGRIGARIELVSAWEYPTSWGNVIPLPVDFDPAADTRSMLEPAVERLAAGQPGLEVHAHVAEGRPGDVLVEASRNASFLVVASRGHGSFSGLLLGSVSQHCVTHAACPVVVHRRPGDA